MDKNAEHTDKNPSRKEILDKYIDSLIKESDTAIETKLLFLSRAQENIVVTEKAIGKSLKTLAILFVFFVFLDESLVDKLVLFGSVINIKGNILLFIPIAMAFSFLQMLQRLKFAEDLRDAISSMYKYMSPAIHKGSLNLLLHYPSGRNIESYYGALLRSERSRKIYSWSTSFVTITYLLIPLLTISYCLYRLYFENAITPFLWWAAVFVVLLIIVRVFAYEFGALSINR